MLEHTTHLKKRLLPCLILAVLALLLSRTAGAQAASVPPNCGSWSVVPSPNVSNNYNVLDGAVALSANDAWAVGTAQNSQGLYQTLTEHWNGSSYKDRRTIMTLVEHWDGTQWSIVSSPSPGKANFLAGVAVIASNNVWASGSYKLQSNRNDNTLVEHWDGSSWSIVASPTPGKSAGLGGVTQVPGTGQLWAVGDYKHKGTKTLTEFYC